MLKNSDQKGQKLRWPRRESEISQTMKISRERTMWQSQGHIQFDELFLGEESIRK